MHEGVITTRLHKDDAYDKSWWLSQASCSGHHICKDFVVVAEVFFAFFVYGNHYKDNTSSYIASTRYMPFSGY